VALQAGLRLAVAGLHLGEADPPVVGHHRDLNPGDGVVAAGQAAEAWPVGQFEPQRSRGGAGVLGVDGGGRELAVGDGVDEVPGPEGEVAAGPDARVGGPQRRAVDGNAALAGQFDARVLAEEANVGDLADGEDHRVGRQDLLGVGDEGRGEAVLGVEYRRHRDRLQALGASLAHDPVRTPAVHDPDPLVLRLGDLLGGSGHLLRRLEGHDGHVGDARPDRRAGHVQRGGEAAAGVLLGLRVQRLRGGAHLPAGGRPQRRAGRVEGDVATADHDHPLAEVDPEPLVHVQEELHRPQHAVQFVAGDVQVAAPAGADGEEHRGMLGQQLLKGYVGADPAAGPDVDAELEDGLDLTADQAAGQAVLGDAEHHHPAEPVLRLVDRDRVATQAQVVGGRQARRPTADDADRRAGGRRDRAVGLVPDGAAAEALHAEPFADKALQRADRDRRVERAAPARRLAGGGADAPADRREGVGLAGDQVGVPVAALGDRGHVGAGVGVYRAGGAARLVLPQPPGVGRGGRQWFAHGVLRSDVGPAGAAAATPTPPAWRRTRSSPAPPAGRGRARRAG